MLAAWTKPNIFGIGGLIQVGFAQSERIFLKHESRAEDKAEFVGDGGVCKMPTFGFSDTGNSFIIATSCDIKIYAKAMPNKSLQRGAKQLLS